MRRVGAVFPGGRKAYPDTEQWAEIRRRVLQEGVSKRQILPEIGMHLRTLEKILSHSAPLGYRAPGRGRRREC